MLKAYSRARALINSVRTEEEGANAVEYALVLGLVAIALVVAAIGLTPILTTFVAEIGTWMDAQGVS
ncbi:Flp family type IVb pilin [Agromyces albus]|uniref:Flp family type IVb pilin n=1 Tax=Agromyces albus TaxID=205332 RepID=A0A4Q2L848_9MICO|nr:Flp family type IVb pilin [Agromyces albus]RXZ72682.1 Flp family type IVb pilin [Agromyces albus]